MCVLYYGTVSYAVEYSIMRIFNTIGSTLQLEYSFNGRVLYNAIRSIRE